MRKRVSVRIVIHLNTPEHTLRTIWKVRFTIRIELIVTSTNTLASRNGPVTW